MNKKYEESVFYTKDNSCPHCDLDIDESELEEILDFGEFTEFDCPHCNNRIKGIADFESFSADVEYHLIALKLISDSSLKKETD